MEDKKNIEEIRIDKKNENKREKRRKVRIMKNLFSNFLKLQNQL